MSDVSLAIIFNHDFSRNIEKLELIYSNRFSAIKYLVPAHYSKLHRYYTDDRIPGGVVYLTDKAICFLHSLIGRKSPHSIVHEAESTPYSSRIHSVVGDQFYFYHYIVQAAAHLLRSNAQWFWFLGDDAILNKGINEQNMLERLGVPLDCDVVFCRPVISDDAWLERIAGSVSGAQKKLVDLLGNDQPYLDKLDVVRENPKSANRTVCVACADLFGLNRQALEKCLPLFRKAQNRSIYVELAVPNILSFVGKRPAVIHEFDWVRNPSDEELNAMIDRMHNSTTAFVHPIKLSMMDKAKVASML